MARKEKGNIDAAAYTHGDVKRLNNPEAGNIDRVPKAAERRKTYNWDPREAPQLVWSGKAGLKMAESKEEMSFEVPLVNLHIHERVAPEAILRSVRREDAQRSLFADPVMDFSKEIQFYQHEVDWANRLILGDSLQVMASLLEREGMRGKVQMIYLDPPYGIKFGSNFQPRIDKRDVKDGADDDLTREVEQVQAFRDTWELGVHSYLSYLRDRLILARELLADSGSVFVQIGDENVHRVRLLMDEVFGEDNSIVSIHFATTSGFDARFLARTGDTLLWYSKVKAAAAEKYRGLRKIKVNGPSQGYDCVRFQDGTYRALTAAELRGEDELPREEHSIYNPDNIKSQGPGADAQEFDYRGRKFRPGPNNHWKASFPVGMTRLKIANRIHAASDSIRYMRMATDAVVDDLSNVWDDTLTGQFGREKQYSVETNEKVIQRCMLMTTDPGDLVLDPTCGSGTTAYVAEQWGRRWITCDTSRVAVAIARHRLMTAAFDYYKLRHVSSGVAGGFRYKTVPHITLKSIAQNAEIDTIAAEYQPKIDAALEDLNRESGTTLREWEVPRLAENVARASSRIADSEDSRNVDSGPAEHQNWTTYIKATESAKAKIDVAREQAMYIAHSIHASSPNSTAASELAHEVSNAIALAQNKADELLEYATRNAASEPPTNDRESFARFWQLKREMQTKIDASIQRNAPQEELVDQPDKESGVVRVSGPFTVEAVPNVSELTVEVTEKVFGDDLQMQIFEPVQPALEAKNVSAYLGDMIEKLRKVGVVTKGKGRLTFTNLRPMDHEIVHAEGDLLAEPSHPGSAQSEGESTRCAVIFGPQNGAVSEIVVREGLDASRRYDAVLFCGYDFTGPAQERLRLPVAGQQVFMAYIAPDTAMTDLLKDTRASQIFTMVGEPDVVVYRQGDQSLDALAKDAARRGVKEVALRIASLSPGEVFLELRGVDLYNPVKGEVVSDSGADVHAIFVDHDYDGKSFCICQALFPNKKDSWEKIERSLKGSIDADAFEAFRTQVTLPFTPGENGRVQIKVYDTRGNAVVKTVRV